MLAHCFVFLITEVAVIPSQRYVHSDVAQDTIKDIDFKNDNFQCFHLPTSLLLLLLKF